MIGGFLFLLMFADEPGKDFVGPPAPPEPAATATTEGPEAVRRKVDQAMKAAEEQLRKQSPGATTQDQQKQALDGLDQLLKLAQTPPENKQNDRPPPSEKPPGNSRDNSSPPESNPGQGPSGGSQSNQRSSKGSSSAGGKPRERRGSRPQSQSRRADGANPGRSNATPSGNNSGASGPRPGDANGPPGANPDMARGATMPYTPTGKPDKLADMTRDVWGHLPDSLRQEVDHYYRERFMPRYQELIRQYYSRLAEADRTKGDRQ